MLERKLPVGLRDPNLYQQQGTLVAWFDCFVSTAIIELYFDLMDLMCQWASLTFNILSSCSPTL